MAGIAISYRREDTAWITGRILDAGTWGKL